MMRKKIFNLLAALVLAATATAGVSASAAAADKTDKGSKDAQSVRVPLNLAVLVQDDLVSRVGNELSVTRDFIRSLPEGSQVMVAYVTAGSLQVRQNFTVDLESAARALRVPVGSTSASPYNPYVEVREGLKRFPEGGRNVNAMLLISDGLDSSRGLDFATSVKSIDLERAISEAARRGVAVYSFYAPSAGLTSYSRTAANYGQSALKRLSDGTGGRAFTQGSSFVTFDPYFRALARAINTQHGGAR
ncbi:MAG TPA: hypothetical protein VER32_11190 [Pyrinomonadaceae bacterium]|nr:hypothetical protein [Pyrinomonadaceae bacterium]